MGSRQRFREIAGSVIQETYYKTMIFPELDYMNNLCICLTEKVPSIWYNKRLQKSIRNEYSPILGSDVFENAGGGTSSAMKYQPCIQDTFCRNRRFCFVDIQPFCGADLGHRMFI